MFFREFKYMLLGSLRSRELIFWTLLFPFALTTFMYMAFGDIFDRTEKFEPKNFLLRLIQEKRKQKNC